MGEPGEPGQKGRQVSVLCTPAPLAPIPQDWGSAATPFFLHRETQASKAPLDSQDPRQVAVSPASVAGGRGAKPRAAWAKWGWPQGQGVSGPPNVRSQEPQYLECCP